jgi:hypothetical protein
MAGRKRKALRVIGWILAGFISLIILITLGFYVGRGPIMKRAVAYLNQNQPGEVQMGQMNLIPLMDFPDVVLQLRNVSYYEKAVLQDSLYQEPILFLNEVYLSLDVVDLVRGNVKVSQARFEEGFIRLEVYEDSVMNLEYALGIRFREETPKDTLSEKRSRRIDLDRIELTNIQVLYQDRVRENQVNLKINQLESRFRSLPEMIEAGIELNVDINNIKYLTYSLEQKEGIHFKSQLYYDPVGRRVEAGPSSLRISGLELETWGTYDFLVEPRVNLAFRATNTGLDVLNFLFMGVLDLDEIEQIGSGSIHMDGSIIGSLENRFPVIRVNGSANRIGFRVKTIERNVTDISFSLFATNGGKTDFSEGQIEVKDFTATFPEGTLQGHAQASNLVKPEINLALKGEVELTGLEQMIKSDKLSELKGHVSLEANLKGVMDRTSDEFLNDAGTVNAAMKDVGFILNRDTISEMHGEVYMEGNIIGTRDLSLAYNGNKANIEVKVENIIHYLLDFERDVIAQISLASDVIMPARILHDTVVTGLIGEEIRDLHFSAGASITKQELDAYIQDDSIPVILLSLDSFGIELPVYVEISNLNAALTFGPDTLLLHYLKGVIGESSFSFSGQVVNHESLLNKDSGAVIGLDYYLTSDLMRAEDLFSYDGDFLLPETYRTEYLKDFHLSGALQLPVEGLVNDSVDLDFGLDIQELGWNFRYYPLAFDNFHLKARKAGKELFIDALEGQIGESNVKMTAMVGNYTDTLWQNLYGNLVLESDLLDFNELLNYQLPEDLRDTATSDTADTRELLRLDQIEYPDFSLNLDVREIRYGKYKNFGIKGLLRSSTEKVFYLDDLVISGESVGTMGFNGQFNVANSWFYNFSADLELKDVNVNDLSFEMQSGEESYTLKENFAGLISATGMAEVFITPDWKLDMTNTTAMFNVQVTDGKLIKFTPLQAVGKFLDNKDLDIVRFSTLRNSFTLMDSKVIIPLMIVESTMGQLLIEGEQSFDGSYLYLMYLPTWLVKEAAKSRLSGAEDDDKEDEIRKMQMGKFMMLTPWSNGTESGVRLGDKRDKYR